MTETVDDVKKRRYRELLEEAEARGFREGWAKYKYKEEFEEWPPELPWSDPAAHFMHLRKIAAEKGFKPGWAFYRFKDVYGTEPPPVPDGDQLEAQPFGEPDPLPGPADEPPLPGDDDLPF